MSTDDTRFMMQALRRASLGRHASPNPMVGCVIVRDQSVVGVGFHPEPGAPHAEIYALREAGEHARGATAYVTLEPCSHFGRTPPCADALIRAGVARVVVAIIDPDPRVSGAGIVRLRDAGIRVDVGICELEARRLNAAFIKHRTTRTPYVIVKVATTLDGKIATANGDSKWITSPITRSWVHRQLRDRVDAIVVGVGTVLADDPSLTTRHAYRETRNPIRVVLDTHLRIPATSSVIRDAPAGGVLIATVDQPSDRDFQDRRRTLENTGATLIECACSAHGKVDLRDLMRRLGERGDIVACLIEGGGNVIGSAFQARIVDRYIATIAPKFVGGSEASGPIGGVPIAIRMQDAVSAKRWIMRRSGPDIVVDTFLNEY